MDFSQLVFLGLLIVAGTGNGFILKHNRTDNKLKIEGGERISIEKAPYQVFIKENEEYICGGVLITPNIVLTAAHCVEDGLKYNETLSVIAGTDNTALDYGVTIKGRVEKFPDTIIMHPMFDAMSEERAMKYDIAIITFDKPFMMTNTISTIDMPTGGVEEGEELLLTGIGAVDAVSMFETSPYLKAYKPKVVRCENYITNCKPGMFANFHGIVCHRSFEGYRSRIGDSGSPMVNSRGKLAAIHRGSTTCDCQVAVDVFYLLDWIKDTIRVNTNEIL